MFLADVFPERVQKAMHNGKPDNNNVRLFPCEISSNSADTIQSVERHEVVTGSSPQDTADPGLAIPAP